MVWSGLLVLVVQYIGNFSLPESNLTNLFFVFLHFSGGFGVHREYEDSINDLKCYYKYIHMKVSGTPGSTRNLQLLLLLYS